MSCFGELGAGEVTEGFVHLIVDPEGIHGCEKRPWKPGGDGTEECFLSKLSPVSDRTAVAELVVPHFRSLASWQAFGGSAPDLSFGCLHFLPLFQIEFLNKNKELGKQLWCAMLKSNRLWCGKERVNGD
jgi:hypothetical protein